MTDTSDMAIVDHEFAKLYYQHQYERIAGLEQQRFAFSTITVTLTVAALTFGFSPSTDVIRPAVLAATILAVNVLAIVYIGRTLQYIIVHRRRAKEILRNNALPLYELDSLHPMPFDRETKLQAIMRPGLARVQLVTHVLLALASCGRLTAYVW